MWAIVNFALKAIKRNQPMLRVSEKSGLANFKFFFGKLKFSASRDLASTRTLGAGPI